MQISFAKPAQNSTCYSKYQNRGPSINFICCNFCWQICKQYSCPPKSIMTKISISPKWSQIKERIKNINWKCCKTEMKKKVTLSCELLLNWGQVKAEGTLPYCIQVSGMLRLQTLNTSKIITLNYPQIKAQKYI